MFSLIKTSTRLSLVTGMLVVIVLWTASGVGLLPNIDQQVTEQRIALTEAAAWAMMPMVESSNEKRILQFMRGFSERNEDVASMGWRDAEGELVVCTEHHPHRWQIPEGGRSSPDQMQVDLVIKGAPAGKLEIAFQPRFAQAVWSQLLRYPHNLFMFCGAAFSLLAWAYLGRVLTYLNPSRAVPTRVRSAFDSLSEGLLLLNTDGRVLLANQAYGKIVKLPVDELIGKNPSTIEWIRESAEGSLPWESAMSTETPSKQLLSLSDQSGDIRRYNVSATPILGDHNDVRGVMISFDDVTQLEQKKEEMASMLHALKTSQLKIEEQNRELQVLASRDPLSGCLNRRAFFEWLDPMWSDDAARGLHIIMVDIDHFKAINDQFGHGVGDEVIRFVGTFLRRKVDALGVVCRYGGEEFCIALTGCDFDEACNLATTLCRELRRYPVRDCRFTASLGVSSRQFNAGTLDELLEQADQCLYMAKRTGRNRAVRWDQRPTIEDQDYQPVAAVRQATAGPRRTPIDFNAVHALFVSLSFHNREVAAHAARVANWCVAVGRNLLPREQLYALEVAALLHDIGILGVPPQIVDKAAPLNREEWEQMSRHNAISLDIVRSVLAAPEVIQFIAQHQVDATQQNLDEKVRETPPESLGARILAVCDAFDCMTAGRVYRAPIAMDDAIAELRRHAPRQFDPVIVERLAAVVRTHPVALAPALTRVSDKMLWTLGSQIEPLSSAADRRDGQQLQQLAESLCLSASEEQATEIEQLARRLRETIATGDIESIQGLDVVEDVLDLCRAARLAWLKRDEAATAPEKTNSTTTRPAPPSRPTSTAPTARRTAHTMVLDSVEIKQSAMRSPQNQS